MALVSWTAVAIERERLNSLFYTLLEAQGATRNFTGSLVLEADCQLNDVTLIDTVGGTVVVNYY